MREVVMRHKKKYEKENGCHHSSSLINTQKDYNINLPLLHPTAAKTAKGVGCSVIDNKISGTTEQIEAFMKMQNPMFQTKYNGSKYLNGTWNPLERTLDLKLPKPQIGKILMSASVLRMDKSVSTGFMPVVYDSFEQVAEAMHIHAHSPSIYSPLCRFNPHKEVLQWEFRRRQHTISFVGNILAYDFDDGKLTFNNAVEILKSYGMNGLVIRSKSDPKYEYDRFKLLIQTDYFYPAYSKDEAPKGFEKLHIDQYKKIYEGLAVRYGFWKYADQSTTDPSRLIAQVNNADFERREYVTV